MMKSAWRRGARVGAALVLALGFSMNGWSLDLVTSGDSCAPVNVGKANRVIQNIRGEITNNSYYETINVSCPLVTEYAGHTMSAVIMAHNDNNFAQEVRCVLREVSIYGEVLNQSVTGGIVPRNGWETLIFSAPFSFSDSRFNVTCSLPPLTSLGYVNVWDYEPS